MRAAAEDVLRQEARESWQRDYRQMARGTLAALDWVEGRRMTTPSSGQVARPGDVIERSTTYRPTALTLEVLRTEDWGSGHVRPPTEDMHFHGAVWALLRWWQHPTSTTRTLAITVPGVTA